MRIEVERSGEPRGIITQKLEEYIFRRSIEQTLELCQRYDIMACLDLSENELSQFALTFTSRVLAVRAHEIHYLTERTGLTTFAATVSRDIDGFCKSLDTTAARLAQSMQDKNPDHDNGYAIRSSQTLAETYLRCRSRRLPEKEMDEIMNMAVKNIRLKKGRG